MDFETYDKADVKSRLQSYTENNCSIFGDLVCVGKWSKTKQFSQFCRPTPQQKMFYVPPPYWKRLVCF